MNIHAQGAPSTGLTISEVSVRRDSEGRYCLNDLHRASGGEDRYSPNRWTRTDGYQALVSELTPEMAFAPAKSIRGGSTPGTYVCRELVFAYATWISPAFFLKVLRTFDAVTTGARYGLRELPEPKTKKALPGGLTLDQQDAIKALVKERVEALPKDKQARGAIACWSSIKSKFSVKTYKEVDAERFPQVVSLLARLPLEGELLPKASAPAAVTAGKAAPVPAQRWLLSFGPDGKQYMAAVPPSAHILEPHQFAQVIGSNDFEPQHLQKVMEAITDRTGLVFARHAALFNSVGKIMALRDLFEMLLVPAIHKLEAETGQELYNRTDSERQTQEAQS